VKNTVPFLRGVERRSKMRKMKVFCKKCGREARILGYIIENVSVIDMESIKVKPEVLPSWAFLTGVEEA